MMSRTGGTLLAVVSLAAVLLAAATLAVVPGGVAAQQPTTFRVTITNATSPEMIVTPGAYLVHATPAAFWASGGAASLSLERIAEVGDPTEAAGALGAMAIDAAPMSGDVATFQFTASPGDLLSTAQMLVATNDGFIGVASVPLFEGGQPRTLTVDLTAWDAGTEANSPLFSGFDGGQPDPGRGADNVENGMSTTGVVAAHPQFSGTQGMLSIAPVQPVPPASGNAGLAGTGGGFALGGVAMLLAVVAGAALIRRRVRA